MPGLITEYSDFDAFAAEWQAANKDETRMQWQLLGLLEEDELLIALPEWLAEEKTGFVKGSTPTMFIGRIEEETGKAIRFTNAAAARPLMKLAHRIHSLEEGIENVGDDADRREWLEGRLRVKRREFETRTDVPGLQEEWLPKSQIIQAVRRGD